MIISHVLSGIGPGRSTTSSTTSDGTTGTLVNGWVSDFLDVPRAAVPPYVTTLVSNAITVGIGGLYGVDQPTLRQQMAVFLLKARHGLCYVPLSARARSATCLPSTSR
jgi:hypothetical protein